MNIKELYKESEGHESLKLLIRFLVKEKKVLRLEDDVSKLEYYLQPKFKNRMNEHLKQYKESET